MSSKGYWNHSHMFCTPTTPVGSGQSRSPISNKMPIKAENADNFLVFFDVSELTVGAGEEVKVWLQQWTGTGWMDVGDPQATALLDRGTGTYCINLDSDIELEAMVMPLSHTVRLVVDTGATSTVEISRVTNMERI